MNKTYSKIYRYVSLLNGNFNLYFVFFLFPSYLTALFIKHKIEIYIVWQEEEKKESEKNGKKVTTAHFQFEILVAT